MEQLSIPRMFAVAILVGTVAGCQKPAFKVSEESGERRDIVRRKSSGPVRLSDAARAAMVRFTKALSEERWEDALSCCSEVIRAEAEKYESAEAFLRSVVPIEKLTAMLRFPVCGGGLGKEPEDFDCFLRLSEPNAEPIISWVWSLYQTESGWEIHFKRTPLKLWIEQETLRKKRIKAERLAKLKALEPKLEGVRTRLTPVSEEFVLGRPMLFRLELVNGGTAELTYDDTQVAVNASMTITDQAGNRVPYIASLCSTIMAPELIRPGESVVLFDKLDISKQYGIKKSGRYAVQFSGRGLSIGDEYVGATRKFPSNVVIIEVASN